MFCEKCGTELKDGAMFCQGCGTKVAQQSAPAEPVQPVQPEWQQPVQPEWQQPVMVDVPKKKGKAGKTIAIIVALLVIIGGGIFAATQLFGGHKKAVEKFLDAYMKDGKQMMLLQAPKNVLKEIVEEDDMTLEEAYEDLQDEIDLQKEYGLKYDLKIKESENLKKLDELEDVAEERGVGSLDDFRDQMDEWLGDYGFDADKITVAYIYEIEGKQISDEGEVERMQYLVAYKYKGKWYVRMV